MISTSFTLMVSSAVMVTTGCQQQQQMLKDLQMLAEKNPEMPFNAKFMTNS